MRVKFNPLAKDECQLFFDPKADIKEAVATDAVVMKDASGNKKWSIQHNSNTVKQDFYSPDPSNQFTNSGFETGITGWANKTLFTGTIAGMYGLEETPVVDGTIIDDGSASDADLQSVAGATSAAGKISNALTFNGSTQYLKQKIYADQTGATWGPTVHGLSLANGQAFARVQGVNLATYASASNDYMLVMKDGESDVAWGYINTADAAEALGSDLVTNGGFDSGTSGWQAGQGATLTSVEGGQSGNSLKVDNAAGAGWGNAYQGITTTAGKLYKLTFYYKNGTTTGYARVGSTLAGQDIYTAALSAADWTLYTVYITAKTTLTSIMFGTNSATNNLTAFYDTISLKEVTDIGTDGVHIVSTKAGSTRNWAGISATFNYNYNAYTFEVRKTNFQITGNLTVGAWVNATDGQVAGSYPFIISKWQTTPVSFLLQLQPDGTIRWFTSNGIWRSSSSALPDGQTGWYYIVATYNSSLQEAHIYINGVLADGSQTGTVPSSLVDCSSFFSIGIFPGTIDEPFVISAALTADHILGMYNDIVKVNAWATSTNAVQSTTQKYAGSNSAKVITGASYRERLTQSLNLGAVSVTLTAYCYTTGAAVTSADAQLWYDADILSSVTYTDMGGGWYRLQKTFTAASASKAYGIVVEAGKTVYIDTLSVQAGTGATIEVSLENSSSGLANFTFENNVTATEVIAKIDGNS